MAQESNPTDQLTGGMCMPMQETDEQGGRPKKFWVAITSLVAVTAFAGLKGNYIGELLGQETVSTEANGGNLSAKVLAHDKIAFTCGSQALVGVTGQADYNIQILGKNIPGAGGNVTASQKDGDQVQATKIGMTTCLDLGKNPASYIDGPVDKSNGHRTLLIKLPLSGVRQDVQIVEDHVAFNPYAASKVAGGGIEAISGAYEIACDATTLGRNQDGCRADASAIDSTYRDMLANATKDTSKAIVQQVQQNVGASLWSSSKAEIIDSIKDQYKAQDPSTVNDVSVEFVDDNGNPTTKLPDFGKDLYQQYRDQGLLQNKSVKSTLNFKIDNQSKPYVSKNPTTGGAQ